MGDSVTCGSLLPMWRFLLRTQENRVVRHAISRHHCTRQNVVIVVREKEGGKELHLTKETGSPGQPALLAVRTPGGLS